MFTSKVCGSFAGWRSYVNGKIALEVGNIATYVDEVIQFKPRTEDTGLLLSNINSSDKKVTNDFAGISDQSANIDKRALIVFNGNLNHHFDIQGELSTLKGKLNRHSRITLILFNPYLKWLYKVANLLGVRRGELPSTFITRTDIENISKISGYDCVRTKPVCYFPFRLFGIGDLINSLFKVIPIINNFSLVHVVTLRPIHKTLTLPKLTIVIPARNEMGNIENAILRLPKFSCDLEIIFVEGHSTDGTWAEIARVKEKYNKDFDIKAFRQTGKGKNDAVRLGFANATGEILTILDADLTMPPELLPRFYEAYCSGLGDFVNGTRLVYPMEGDAMRFLNLLGNIFFAKALGYVLDSKIGDSLCGTKLISRKDYRRIVAWRNDFGDFDPFGDFELLFPAATMALGIIDIPIRYGARTYGSTNISRFKHGAMLLKMTFIGLFRIKLR